MKRGRREKEPAGAELQGSGGKGRGRGAKLRPSQSDVLRAALGPDPPPELAGPDDLFADIQAWAREAEEEPQPYADWLDMERYAPAKRNVIYLLPLGINETVTGPGDCDGGAPPRDQAKQTNKRRTRKKAKKNTDDDDDEEDEDKEDDEEEYDLQFDEVHPDAPTVAQLAEFVAAFFHGLEVKVMRPLSFVKEAKGGVHILSPPYQYPIKSKRSKTFGNERLYDMDILRVIKELLPKDGFCVVAVTARDIYEHPREDAEIVLGRGTGDRVGVISLYHHGKPQGGATRRTNRQSVGYTPEEKLMWKLRTCKTMAHEMCHIFGIDHCVYYTCLMNAHASPDGEDDAEALHLCPIDLRKLCHRHATIGFDIAQRYQRLCTYYTNERWRKEAEWVRRRLLALGTPSTASAPASAEANQPTP